MKTLASKIARELTKASYCAVYEPDLTQIGFFSFEFLAQLLSHVQFDLAIERLIESKLVRTFRTRDFLLRHYFLPFLV
jgi:hypothetical protein